MSQADSQVVVVTGAAVGLGRALCEAFGARGYRVVGLVRRVDAAAPTADRVQADVADAEAVLRAVEQIVGRHGRIDVWFNNAALYPRINFVEESAADWARALAVNVNGVANCCKAVLPTMIRQGRGRIYNVGSFADISPIPNSAAYAASKGAVHALTKGVGADLESLGLDIQVHEWNPGHMNTRMSDFTGADPAQAAQWAVDIVARDDATQRSGLFVNDREWRPAVSWKRRWLNRLRGVRS